MNKKMCAIGMLLIMLGGVIIPSIQANLMQLKQNENVKTTLDEKMVNVTLGISTFTGIQKIEKRVSARHARQISAMLRNTSNALSISQNQQMPQTKKEELHHLVNATVHELKRLELLPTNMSNDKIKALINGEYLRNVTEKKLPNKKIIEQIQHQNSSWKHNTCSGVVFEGDPSPGLMHFLSTIPFDVLMELLFLLNAPLAVVYPLILAHIVWSWVPKCIIPIAFGELLPWWNCAYINTHGLLGNWKLTSGLRSGKINVLMIGAIGIWFINDAYGIYSQMFIGSALYVGAKKS